MQIQVNTDHNIEGHETLAVWVTSAVESALGRLADHVTRVEVHLSDENSNKKHGKDEIRCLIEARLERHQPVAVTQHDATVQQAVNGAAVKLVRLLENTLGRLHEQQSHRIDPSPSETDPAEEP
jgi:ribosome-associated translation inhibitor RaiA